MFAGRAEAAWAAYQDFLDVEEFSNSAEAMSAENLLDGYCSADPAVIKQRLKQGRCWQGLDGPVRCRLSFTHLCQTILIVFDHSAPSC
jgi:hypothetical protein